MRMIDADALSRIVKLAWETSDSEDFEKSVFIAIATAPTIERKKGKWIETDSHEPCWYKCDQCGRLHDFLDNYCPNCGSYNGGD